MKKDTFNIVILAGIGIAAYLFFKGGKKIIDTTAQALNIQETPQEKESAAQYSKEPTVNPWNRNYYRQLIETGGAGKKVKLLTKANAEAIAKSIYDSIYKKLPIAADSARILGEFAKLRYKSQVSFLSEVFYNKYKADMLTYLDNGVPFFIGNTGLPDQSMRKLMDYVNKLPSGLYKPA